MDLTDEERKRRARAALGYSLLSQQELAAKLGESPKTFDVAEPSGGGPSLLTISLRADTPDAAAAAAAKTYALLRKDAGLSTADPGTLEVIAA